MNIKIGDRATYRGEQVIIMDRAPWLSEERWHVKVKDGEVRTGWRHEIAHESALSNITTPEHEVGEKVRLGYSPIKERGTVTEVDTLPNGRKLYTILIPADENELEGDQGTRVTKHEESRVVGAEFINT